MEYNVTQTDLNLLNQPEKIVFLKLNLLSRDGKIINSLEGNLINDDFSNDADSQIRRTYNCTFYVDDESWKIGKDKNIWIDKLICPYVGYQSVRDNTIHWYKKGTYALNQPTMQFNETEHTISLSCLDLMCEYDGTLGGEIGGDAITGLTRKIPVGTNIRSAIIAILDEAGIKKYNVCNFNKVVPYDIEVNVGTTYYAFLEQVIALYSGYEFFFDIDGTFIVQLIPQLKSEPVLYTSDIINELVISEQRVQDWSTVRNFIEVYGQTISPQFYTTEIAGTINAWTATLEEVTSYENGDTYAFVVPTTNGDILTININNLGAKPVYDDDGKLLIANKLIAGKTYVFRYRKDVDNMIFLGQYQAYGYYEETSIDCPFSTTNLGYRINGVVTDDNIYSDSLCTQRAKYEVYCKSWMQDTISLEMIDIPFLCVNQKIGYIPVDEVQEVQYIVKKITSNSAAGTMSIDLVKFSESYPDMDTVYESMYGETIT